MRGTSRPVRRPDPPTDPEIGLEDLQDNPNVSVSTDSDGTVRVVNGAFTDTTVTDAVDAAQVIDAMSELIGAPADFAAADNITVQKVGTDGGFSETFYRVNQSVDGVEVLGGQVVLVTDADGKVMGLFNNYDSRADSVDTTMSRGLDTENEAAAAALAAYVGSSNSLPYRLLAPALIKAGVVKADLVIDDLADVADPQRVWRVVVNPPDTSELTGSVDAGSTYYISANGTTAGSVQREVSNADALTVSSSATTTAKDELGVSRDINISQLNLLIFSLDILDDKTRDITTHITSYLLFAGPPLTPGIVAIRGLNGWDAEAVSAQANVAEVYDYYSNVLGLPSFDGSGAPIVVSVDYNPRGSLDDYVSGYQNAFWDASKQQFMFGNSGDLESALDVVGHEYTHAVIAYALGDGNGTPLDYGESGALNEAYADIMGSLIEGKAGEDRWLIGEDSTFDGGPVRNLADPTSIDTADGPYRDNYADLYTGDDDEGGEHVNSTIFSHAAYLMMTDERTADITEDDWAELYYHSMYRLSPGADFADGRAAVVSTATAMAWTSDQIDAINDAFDEVGIEDTATVTV